MSTESRFVIDENRVPRASRFILRGALIWEEEPLAILPEGTTSDEIQAEIPEPDFGRLPIRDLFLHHHPAVAKFKSNRLYQGTQDCGDRNVSMFGVYHGIAAFFSSYPANLHLHWNGTSMQLRALDNIPEQTQLSISHDLDRIMIPCQIEESRQSSCPLHIPISQWFDIDDNGAYRASTEIPQGTVVYQERPWATLQKDATAQMILNGMDQSRHGNFNQLRIRTHVNLSDPIIARFKSNRLRQGTKIINNTTVTVYGIFPDTTAFPSSCRPNLYPQWNEQSMALVAAYKIPAGSILGISHDIIGLLESSQNRRIRLRELYLIDCQCRTCCGSPNEVNTSDERRASISPVVQRGRNPQGHPVSPDEIKSAFDILLQEDIYVYRDTLAFDLYKHYRHSNNAMLSDEGKTWLGRAIHAAIVLRSPNDRRVTDMRQLYQNYPYYPGHPHWPS